MRCSIGLILGLYLFVGCSGLEESENNKIRKMNAIGEYIYRRSDDKLFAEEPLKRYVREKYPWEETYIGQNVKITKEFFRCKGSQDSAPITTCLNGKSTYVFDCGGMQQHSLPFLDGKEHIYSTLIELLNYVQEKTGKKVIITCGHRCPTHNIYADNSEFNRTSKHMIGAEVDFYVKGMEWTPKAVVQLLIQYYQEHPRFKLEPSFNTFNRYELDTNVSTLPWHNKEVFIKLFKQDEGRDIDNAHRFPYISIQLKWDRDKHEGVAYSWSKAFNGYLRY